jgi:gamma-glutamylcyclotransferase (GGCT)/AIG2-like uncharacterized protein YtfP
MNRLYSPYDINEAARQGNRFYGAYGSNMNTVQMEHRCNGAQALRVATLENYKLTFAGHGFANVEPCKRENVTLVIWDVNDEHVAALDRYEGTPTHYVKKHVWVRFCGADKKVRVFIYVMTPVLARTPCPPSKRYYAGIAQAYRSLGLSTEPLSTALIECAKNIKKRWC